METQGFFNLKLSLISLLAVAASFEYLCYGSTNIINIFTLSVWGLTLAIRILMSTDVRLLRLKSIPTL